MPFKVGQSLMNMLLRLNDMQNIIFFRNDKKNKKMLRYAKYYFVVFPFHFIFLLKGGFSVWCKNMLK